MGHPGHYVRSDWVVLSDPNHYRKVRQGVRQLEEIMSSVPSGQIPNEEPPNPNERTAIILVSVITGSACTPGFPFFGNFPSSIAILSCIRAEIDSGAFKGASELRH